MAVMKLVKPSSVEEKQTKTTMDVVELNAKLAASWKRPPFQRELRVTAKVLQCAEAIQRAGGVLPGVLTIGVFDGELWVVDGQHRIAAWQHTAMLVGYADVRTQWFDSMAEMAAEYVRLNSQLVRLRPDDILRGLEPSTVALQKIRRSCGWIGYDMVRRSQRAPMVSMSAFIRTWAATTTDVPAVKGSMESLAMLDDEETDHAIDFARLCFDCWRRDPEYARLWVSLNLALCAWLYRRLVLGFGRHPNTRADVFTREDFRRCLLGLSADSSYLEFLVGRYLGDRDRSPAYNRVKQIFRRRHHAETGRLPKLPSPAWAHDTTLTRTSV